MQIKICNKYLKQFLTRHIILSFIVMRSNVHINDIDVLVYLCIVLVSFSLFIRLIMPNTIHHCREVKVVETCSYHNQSSAESNTSTYTCFCPAYFLNCYTVQDPCPMTVVSPTLAQYAH